MVEHLLHMPEVVGLSLALDAFSQNGYIMSSSSWVLIHPKVKTIVLLLLTLNFISSLSFGHDMLTLYQLSY